MKKLTKFEKIVLVGSPWFFGVVSIASGLYTAYNNGAKLISLLLIVTGFICISLYCIASLLAKILEK